MIGPVHTCPLLDRPVYGFPTHHTYLTGDSITPCMVPAVFPSKSSVTNYASTNIFEMDLIMSSLSRWLATRFPYLERARVLHGN